MNSKITIYNVLIAALMIPEMSRMKKNKGDNILNLQTELEKTSTQVKQK
jgi:hypothetical protein